MNAEIRGDGPCAACGTLDNKENSLRGDAPNIVLGRMGMCKYGHAMTPANTIYRTRGHGKRCRECVQILDRKRKRAKS